jgi:hypothetical protein
VHYFRGAVKNEKQLKEIQVLQWRRFVTFLLMYHSVNIEPGNQFCLSYSYYVYFWNSSDF